MGGSLANFIDYNTGDVTVMSCNITSASPSEVSKTKNVWMHFPNPTPTPSNDNYKVIELTVVLNNSENYDLDIKPVIWEFIGVEGVRVSDPQNRPVSVIPAGLNTYKIRIGNMANLVEQGDSFKIRIDIATSDGSRVFTPYDVPQIIYDNVFRSAKTLTLTTATSKTKNSSYPEYTYEAGWTIQGSSEHMGINMISITFIKKSTGERKYLVYSLQADAKTWVNSSIRNDSSDPLYPFRSLYIDPATFLDPSIPRGFSLLFPFDVRGYSTDPIGDFIFLIDLTDKNGLTVSAGQNGSWETYLHNLYIGYHYLGNAPNDFEDQGYDFISNIDNLTQKITVPYKVDAIKFLAVPNTDTDIDNPFFGTQQVLWGSNNTSQMEFTKSLGTGAPNEVDMTVKWLNSNTDDPDNLFQLLPYTFLITRLSPARDSTLKNLIIQDADTSTTYTPVNGPLVNIPGYVDGNKDVNGNPVTIITNYTVYVPSGVKNINILGDYLSTSTIYNQNGIASGLPNLGSPYPITQQTIPSTDPNYPGYLAPYPLYILRNGWRYTGIQTGTTNFYIYVKSEYDDPIASPIRLYKITVIKTDIDGNPNASLVTTDGLTVKAGTQTLLDSSTTNIFSPGVLNYVVNVPYNVSDSVPITISAKTVSGADIREITSVDLSNNTGDKLDLTPPVVTSPGTPITALNALKIPFNLSNPLGIKKRVTLTVYSAVDSTPKNYTITLVRKLPALPPPSLAGGDRSLTISNLSGASA